MSNQYREIIQLLCILPILHEGVSERRAAEEIQRYGGYAWEYVRALEVLLTLEAEHYIFFRRLGMGFGQWAIPTEGEKLHLIKFERVALA
jgi:hypothetical protein